MVETRQSFEQRLTTLGRKHAAMGHGYITQLRGDGLIVMQPKRRMGRGFPIRGLFTLVAGFFVFKGLMLASLGDITYNERVAKLQQGGHLEQFSSYMMQIDPVTEFAAGFLEPLVS